MSTFTIISNNNTPPTSTILWSDTETNENRVGLFSTAGILVANIEDFEGSTVYSLWQINTGSGFVDNIFYLDNPETFSISGGVTQFRLKNTDAFGMVGYSNILQYTYNPPRYDNYTIITDLGTCNIDYYFSSEFSVNSASPVAFNKLGYNYSGALPATLRILSYQNFKEENGIQTTLSDNLEDGLGNPLTYPYNVTLGFFTFDSIDVYSTTTNKNFLCPVYDVDNLVTHYSITEYEIIDINGASGGVKSCNIISRYKNTFPEAPVGPPPPPENPMYPLPGYNFCISVVDCDYPAQIRYVNVFGEIVEEVLPCGQATYYINQLLSGAGYEDC